MKITLNYFIVFVIIILNGCGTSSQKASIYNRIPKHIQPKIDVLPLKNTYNFNKKLDISLDIQLNEKIDELFSKYDIAGISATILVPKKGIWEINKGFRSKASNKIVDQFTVFYWASVTKLITSVIVHKLILEGKLSFDDKLVNWFPDIGYSDKITINQLLSHTNGIYSFNYDSKFHNSKEYFSPEELLEASKSHNNLFEPGKYWSYTNTGYLLLALIAEEIEAKPFSKIVEDIISEPLNLKSLKVATKNEPNLALAHNKNIVIYEDYTVPLGAGNIFSNSKDMVIFFSELLTGNIMPINIVHNMMKDLYLMFDKGHYYGKGIMLYDFKEINKTKNIWIGHSGGTENYKTILLYDIKTKIIMAISINEDIHVESIAYKLLELIKEHNMI